MFTVSSLLLLVDLHPVAFSRQSSHVFLPRVLRKTIGSRSIQRPSPTASHRERVFAACKANHAPCPLKWKLNSLLDRISAVKDTNLWLGSDSDRLATH